MDALIRFLNVRDTIKTGLTGLDLSALHIGIPDLLVLSLSRGHPRLRYLNLQNRQLVGQASSTRPFLFSRLKLNF